MSEYVMKKDGGKPPIDLIDTEFLEDVAQVLAFGAKKYAPGGWRKGMHLGKCLAGVLRHCFAMLRGEYRDPESGCQHAAHAVCGLMFAWRYIRDGQTTIPDDRWGAANADAEVPRCYDTNGDRTADHWCCQRPKGHDGKHQQVQGPIVYQWPV